MSRSDRLLRRVESWLIPWFDRSEHEAKQRHAEELRQQAIRARVQLEEVRRAYALAAERLNRR